MTPAAKIRLESAGEPSLDAILGGGIPAQSVTVIAGEPGSGKTILSLQMLFCAARDGKKSIYFTTVSEPAMKIIRYMQAFDFFRVEFLDTSIHFVDLAKAVREGAEATTKEIVSRIEQFEPDFVVIDSFRAIGEMLGQAGNNIRPFVYDLATQMSGWGATTLLVGEYDRADIGSFAEFAIADGILFLGAQRQELTSIREIEVIKLRGAASVSGRHFFDITDRGLSVFPRVRAPVSTEAAPTVGERVSTGVAGLDDLFNGGLPRGGTTVVQGGTGTGKTVLGLNFLVDGMRRGERAVLFTLEETPDQLREIAKGLGWDLADLEQQGVLAIKYQSPVELSTDRFLNEASIEVQRLRARRVLFDSLTTMALGVPSERRFKELVYAISKHMRSYGATVIMTMESEQLLGSPNLSGLGVSFIADNLIQLRYLEMDGQLERAISVIKARGIRHKTELRGASIGDGGMSVVAERFADLRGVLTGLPSRGSPRDGS